MVVKPFSLSDYSDAAGAQRKTREGVDRDPRRAPELQIVICESRALLRPIIQPINYKATKILRILASPAALLPFLITWHVFFHVLQKLAEDVPRLF